MTSLNNKDRKGIGGPKTPEGKARSSMNALRHGACSCAILLATESETEFERLERNYYDHWQPATFQECELLDEMITAKWRQRRCWNVETSSIDLEIERSTAEFERIHNLGEDGGRQTALAVGKLSDESSRLQSLSRYEMRYHRIYHRALDRLIELQEKRIRDGHTVEPPPQNENLPNELPETASPAPKPVPIRPAAPRARLSLSNFHRPRIRAAGA